MKLSEVKKKMLAWEDFYGADIFETDKIKRARNKKQLAEVLNNYSKHMEDRECDARAHFEKFRREMGLDIFLEGADEC